MPTRKMRAPARCLRMFSYPDCESASNFAQANSECEETTISATCLGQSSRLRPGYGGRVGRSARSICPKEVFQAQMIQPGLGFFASVAIRCGQALVNRSRGLPFRIFL